MLTVDLACHGIAKTGKILEPETRCQLIIDVGLALLAQFIHRHLEYGSFASEMGRLVVLGEANLDIACLAGLHADQPFLEPGDEAVRAKLKRMPLGSTALERLAIDPADEVDDDDVAVFCGTLRCHLNRRAVALGDVGQRLVDLGVASLKGRLLDVQGRQIGNVDVGHDLAGQRRFQILAILIGGDLDTRLAGKTQFVGLDGLARALVEGVFHCLALDLAAEAGLDHRHRNLARAEARHVHSGGEFGKLGRYLFIDLRGRNDNRIFADQAFGLGFRNLHRTLFLCKRRFAHAQVA